MNPHPLRRRLLLSALAVPVMGICQPVLSDDQKIRSIQKKLAAFETVSGGRLGVFAINTERGSYVQYRANERFAFCSTFKAIVAAAILQRSMLDRQLMQQRVVYQNADLVIWSPVTEKHVDSGMTVAELCEATIRYSDNTAVNLLIKQLGGLDAVNRFARSVGDRSFRLDRWEPDLNSAIPGDVRDTTTPASMARTLQRLTLGDVLGDPPRDQFQRWLKGNTTGAESIRAGVPAGWAVGDKTGTGSYGTTNDIGVLWPPGEAPIVMVVFFTQKQQDAKARRDVIAEATRIVLSE